MPGVWECDLCGVSGQSRTPIASLRQHSLTEHHRSAEDEARAVRCPKAVAALTEIGDCVIGYECDIDADAIFAILCRLTGEQL